MAGAGGPVTAGPVTQMAVAGGALGTPVTLATAQQLQQQMANQQQVAGATQQLRLGRVRNVYTFYGMNQMLFVHFSSMSN